MEQKGCVLTPLTFHTLEMCLVSEACGRGLAKVLGLPEPCRTALVRWGTSYGTPSPRALPVGHPPRDTAEQGTLPEAETWGTLQGTQHEGTLQGSSWAR